MSQRRVAPRETHAAGYTKLSSPLLMSALSHLDLDSLLSLKEEIENLLDTTSLPAPNSIAAAASSTSSLRRLAVVVGHTKSSPGAFGITPINANEYAWNSDLADRIMAECASADIEGKVFFRDKIGVSGVYKQVAAWGAHACVELHFNWGGGSAKGTETLFGVACKDSEAWATVVQKGMVNLYKRTGKQDRGLLKCPPYKRGSENVNALSSIPSCLIEPFFGDNKDDAKLGHDYKQSLAKTLVSVFDEHIAAPPKATVPAAKKAAAKKSTNVVTTPPSGTFADFIANLGLRHFTADEVLRPTYNTNNGVANSRPPEVLWHNIVPTLIVLDAVRAAAGVPISLNSTYRSKAYNNTLSGAAQRSQHLDFRAIDFASSKMKPADLAKIARGMRGKKFTVSMPALNLVKDLAPLNLAALQIRSSGGKTTFEFHGGIAVYNTFVHMDCRGEDQEWG